MAAGRNKVEASITQDGCYRSHCECVNVVITAGCGSSHDRMYRRCENNHPSVVNGCGIRVERCKKLLQQSGSKCHRNRCRKARRIFYGCFCCRGCNCHISVGRSCECNLIRLRMRRKCGCRKHKSTTIAAL
ncbi:hypothetical protein PoB_005354100 [Plakobranchus ocellatus]|uniref:Uncharacterized protein n=1 Tax=Plakobranchus ocellatus TaxID=259542 RepID=A0AAV4C2P2_9GAST|nr:hypothetical protein PoB_005354100 [Plakobranchus ocellatus]